jgi:hypothetical protein
MDSFDDRGGGRSVAKNLYASDSYDAEEDTWGKLPESKGKLPESKGKLPTESMGTFPGKPQAKEKTASKQSIAEKDQDVAEKVFAHFCCAYLTIFFSFLHYCSCERLFISPFLTHAFTHIRNTIGHQYLK